MGSQERWPRRLRLPRLGPPRRGRDREQLGAALPPRAHALRHAPAAARPGRRGDAGDGPAPALTTVRPTAHTVSDRLERWLGDDTPKTLGGLVAAFGDGSFAMAFVLLMAL